MGLMKMCYISEDGKRRVSFFDTSELSNENNFKSPVDILKYNLKNKTDVASIIEIKSVFEIGKLMLLRFEYDGEKLSVFNYMYSIENRKKIEITKINGIPIDEIINIIQSKFDKNVSNDDIAVILCYPDVLQELGVVDKGYILTFKTLVDDEFSPYNKYRETDMDLTNLKDFFEPHEFYKKHSKQDLVNNFHKIGELDIKTGSDSNNLNYALDSSVKILKLLSEISQSGLDKRFFYEVGNNFTDNKVLNSDDISLDWMIISSFFLLNEKSKKEMPNIYSEYFKEFYSDSYMTNCYFLDSNNNYLCRLNQKNLKTSDYKNNNYIIENNNLNYDAFFTSIRNALAHSSYEIIDEERIRIYSYDDNNIMSYNVIITKSLVKKLIEDSINFGSISSLFPIITVRNDEIYQYNVDGVKNKEQFRELLKSRTILRISNIEYKDTTILDLGMFHNEIRHFNRYWKNGFDLFNSSDELINSINHMLSPFLKYNIVSEQLTDKDMDLIIEEIDKKYKDFYNLSVYNQLIILSKMIRNKENDNSNLLNTFSKIINSREKYNNSLEETMDETVTESYDLENYYKVLIISFLNNILLYSYNENTSIDTSEINLTGAMNIDKDKLIKKKEQTIQELHKALENIGIEEEEIKAIIEKQEKTLNNPNFQMNARNDVKLKIALDLEKSRDRLIRFSKEKQEKMDSIQEKIELHSNLYSDMLSNNFDIDSTILRHLRNSLAHGNIRFPKGIDIFKLRMLELEFEDIDPKTNEQTFIGNISLESLLKALSNKKFIDSIYINNSHLNKH